MEGVAADVVSQRDGSVLVLSLARAPTNAIDGKVLSALSGALAGVERDVNIRAVILTSAVPGIFSSGGDLRFWQRRLDASFVAQCGSEVVRQLAALPVLSVAAMDGPVVGDALAFALACDIRIASPRTTFQLPEVALGFIPGWGTVHRLLATVGRSHAAAMLILGKRIDAANALRIGLVNEIVDERELLATARAIARRGDELSPRALRAARCALQDGDEPSCFASTWGSEDWAIGVSALLGKKKPIFTRSTNGGCCQ